MSRLNNRDPCSLYDACYGHLTEEGNDIVARAAYSFLQERQILINTPNQNEPSQAN